MLKIDKRKGNNMKIVIYKGMGIYKTTTEENYNKRIQNASQICCWENFETAEEIINYCVKYCGKKAEDFIIV